MTVTLRPVYLSLAFAVALMAVGALVFGKELLIPLAVAVMLWYVLNALAGLYGRIRIAQRQAPAWLRMTAAVLTAGVAFALFVEMVSGHFAEVSAAAPAYQANLEKIVRVTAASLGLPQAPTFAQLVEQIDLGQIVSRFAATVAGLASSAGIILIYVVFLLIEQQSFEKKLHALFPDPQREQRIRRLLHRIQEEIQTYIWIKTLLSIATGAISYVVLIAVGVDFAVFWAFVIFLLNYIPTIGSLLGIVLPALLTLVQFGELVPFVVVVVALGLTQGVIGNVIEPRLMGRSLNLSPLVVILSLALWGTIWGIAGMFLCVPLTVVAMIILSHFPSTRPVAILLSSDGRIETDELQAAAE